MTLRTWREDPVENRKLQEKNGANVVGDVKQVGGYKPVKDFFLSYPLDRSSRPEGEDSFLIQAV